MRASLDWIREWVKLDGLSAKEIAHKLTMAGLEVDAVHAHGVSSSKIIAVKILTIEPHPGADKLRLCVVDTGAEQVQVVCGAPTLEVGWIVPWAQPGSTLPNGVTLSVANIRGVESPGMLCSPTELGIDSDYDGLLRLDAFQDIELGQPIAELPALSDTIFELSLTPNRADALSIQGIARELGVLYERTARRAQPPEANESIPNVDPKVIVEDSDACPYYSLTSYRDIQAQELPIELSYRFKTTGHREIAVPVDLTNLLLFEIGQPFHAFDADKVQGDVTVRRARDGEVLDALDDNDYTLRADDLVIADESGPIALAGVMGGRRTMVDRETRDILVECALFEPSTVRRSARYHGLHSDSSHRYERGIDPKMTLLGSDAYTELLQRVERRISGSSTHVRKPDAFTAVGELNAVADEIELDLKFPQNIIGMQISADSIHRILERLGCSWELDEAAGKAKVRPPSWRVDLNTPIDLVEEIARIIGYDAIPASLPPFTPGLDLAPNEHAPHAQLRQPIQSRSSWGRLRSIRATMRAAGFDETVQLALADVERQSIFKPAEHELVQVANPLTRDLSVLRTSLLPGLLDTLAFNRRRNIERGAYFELASVATGHKDSGGESIEDWTLAAASWGSSLRGWHAGGSQTDAYELRAAVEQALGVEGIYPQIARIPDELAPAWSHPGLRAAWMHGGEPVGIVAAVHPDTLDLWDMDGLVYVASVKLTPFMQRERALSSGRVHGTQLPRTRDLAIQISREISWSQILDTINGLKIAEIHNIQLFDLYQGEHLRANEQSLAFRLHLVGEDATLDDSAIDAITGRVLEALIDNFGAVQR